MDIKLIKQDDTLSFDVGLSGRDIETDDGLETAVIISLFTDRRAEDDDDLPDNSLGRRGWWADYFGGKIGSRLWLLSRSKQTQTVVNQAVEYAREALQWLVDDGVAAGVDVEGVIPRSGVLGLEITITRGDGRQIKLEFTNIWEAMDGV